MKKLKNILFILIVLLVPNFVKASSVEGIYNNKWDAKYGADAEAVFYSVIAVDDGTISAGSEYYCETVDDEEVCTEAGLIVKYDNDGNLVWSNSLFDEAEGFGSSSVILDMVLVDEGIMVLVEETIYGDDGDEYYLGIMEFDLNGEFIDGEGVAFEQVDNMAYLSVYNGYVAVAYNTDVLIFDDELELIYTFENYVYPNVIMNENGIYVAGLDGNTANTVVLKYDYNFNEVGSRTINVVDLNEEDFYSSVQFVMGMTSVDDNIYIASSSVNGGLVTGFDKSLNEVIKKDTGDSLAFGISVSHDGFVLLERKESSTCEVDENSSVEEVAVALTSSSCATEDLYYLSKYDNEMNKLWENELGYFPRDIVSVDTGVVVAGAYESDEIIGKTTMYEYVDYEINVVDDGNGTVTMNNANVTGDEVEIVIEPKEGYQVKKVVVTTASGKTIEVTDYKFIMPNEDIEVNVEFEKVFNPNTGLSNPFVICGSILGIALISSLIVKKKKFM